MKKFLFAVQLLVLEVVLPWGAARASGLVGPGAVSPYSGGRRSRSRGYATVRDPSHGFYIGGSSIDAMNGLYGRINSIHHPTIHTEFHLAYKHDYHNWFLCLVKSDPKNSDYEVVGSKKSEWVIIDDGGNDRFGHEGDTIIPGSGTSWQHVHRSHLRNTHSGSRERHGKKSNENAVRVLDSMDNKEELPWSVVAIMGEDMMNKLRRRERHRRHRIQLAEVGHGLPSFGAGSQETGPGSEVDMDAQFVKQAIFKEANELFDSKRYEEAKEKYYTLLERSGKIITKSSHLNMWGYALLYKKIAAAARRLKEYQLATKELTKALQIYPRFKDAIFQLAVTLFDSGEYRSALHNFEKVLRLDRAHKDLDRLLTLTMASIKRRETLKKDTDSKRSLHTLEEQETAQCIAWRQTGNCDGINGERETEYDLGCNQNVPTGASGYCECRNLGTMEHHPTLRATENSFRASTSGCGHEEFTCAQRCLNEWNLKIQRAHQYESELESKGVAKEKIDQLAKIRQNAIDKVSNFVNPKKSEKEERMKEGWRTQNHYELLGVFVDFSADELRKSYRKMSVKYHPDKRKDKSNEAFQAVAAAYEILQDDEKRMDYDFGKEFDPPEDSNRYPYREDILRQYFPERFKFEPFGDPHLNDYGEVKRDLLAFRKRKQEIHNAEEEKARLGDADTDAADSKVKPDVDGIPGGFEPIENFDDEDLESSSEL